MGHKGRGLGAGFSAASLVVVAVISLSLTATAQQARPQSWWSYASNGGMSVDTSSSTLLVGGESAFRSASTGMPFEDGLLSCRHLN